VRHFDRDSRRLGKKEEEAIDCTIVRLLYKTAGPKNTLYRMTGDDENDSVKSKKSISQNV
jgi:hypothetical protein